MHRGGLRSSARLLPQSFGGFAGWRKELERRSCSFRSLDGSDQRADHCRLTCASLTSKHAQRSREDLRAYTRLPRDRGCVLVASPYCERARRIAEVFGPVGHRDRCAKGDDTTLRQVAKRGFNQTFVVVCLAEVYPERARLASQLQCGLKGVSVDLEVALGELVALPLGVEAQPIINVVHELSCGDEHVRLLSLQPLNAERTQAPPVIRLGEWFASKLGGRQRSVIHLCERDRVIGVVAEELLREDVGVLCNLRGTRNYPMRYPVRPEDLVDLVIAYLEPYESIAEQDAFGFFQQRPAPSNRLCLGRR